MITNEQRARLTETKFFKVEVGQKVRLVLKEWGYREDTFKEADGNVQVIPTLSFIVESINDIKVTVPKEWNSRSKTNNIILLDAIDKAEREGRDFIAVEVFRINKTQYNITDLTSMINSYRR